MSRRIISGAVFLLLLFFTVPLTSATMPGVVFNQTGYQTVDNNIKIELLPTGNQYMIADVYLRYRPAGDLDFTQIPMTSNGFKYETELNIKDINSRTFEYEFAITDKRGNSYLYSANEAGDLPFRFNITQQENDNLSESEKVQAVVISPLPDETVSEEDFIGVVSLLTVPGDFAIERTKIFVDGIDYTGDGNIGESVITFAPDNLSPGGHKILVQFYASDGRPLNNLDWDFNLLRESSGGSMARRFNGRFYVNNQYKKTGVTDSLPDGTSRYNYLRGGTDFTGQFSAFDFGGRFFFSSEESADIQPVNIYNAYLKMNLGKNSFIRVSGIDNYPNYNKLVVKDKRMRGLSGTVKLGWIELSAATGTTRRSIMGLVRPDTLVTDSLGNDALNAYDYTYQRDAFAGRFALGSPNGLLLGLSLYKAKDDESSLKLDYGDENKNSLITIGGAKPKENLVIGTDLTLRLFKRHLEIYGLGAVSVNNSDITGGSIPLDTLKKYVESWDDSYDQYYDIASKYMTVNLGLGFTPGLSYETGVKLRFWNNFFQGKYEAATPEFVSLGLQFYRSDYEAIRLSDGITLLDNSLALNVGYDLITYNKSLDNAIKNNQLNFSVGYNPGPSFPTISFNLLNINRNSVNDDVDIPVEESFKSYAVTAGYLLNLLGTKHNVSLTMSQNNREDPNTPEGNSLSNVLNITVRSLFDFPLRTRLSFDKNLSETGDDSTYYNSTFSAFTLGADYMLQKFFMNWDLQVGGYGKFGSLNDESSFYGSTDRVRNLYNGFVMIDLHRLGVINSSIDYFTLTNDDGSTSDIVWTTRYSINF